MSCAMGDAPPASGRRRMIKKINPYRSSSYHCFAYSRERNPPTILNPSRGWIGIRLKTQSKTFIEIIVTRNAEMIGMPINETSKRRSKRRRMDAAIARRMFESGPAREIIAASFLEFRRLKGSNSTGFPQPKRNNRSIIKPIGSMCAMGLSVSRPCILGVGSPNLSAATACANS